MRSTLPPRPQVITHIFIALSIAVAVTVLLGWALSIPALTQIRPNWLAMQPLSATLLIVSATALLLYTRKRRRVASYLAMGIATCSALVLLQHTTGVLPWMDTLLFPQTVLKQFTHLYPGRPAEIVSIEFLLFSLFLAWPRRTSRLYRRATLLANLGFLAALVAMAGHFLGARELTTLGGYASMSAPTSVGVLLLFAAALAAQKDRNWIHVFTAPNSTRAFTRKLLLIVMAGPVALAVLIAFLDTPGGESHSHLEFAIYVLALSIGLAIAITQFGKRLAATEAQRTRAMRDAEASRVRLALALEAGSSVVWELNTATGRVLQNDGRLCRRLGYAGDDLASQAAWFAVCHEEDRTVVREAMDSLVHGRKDTARNWSISRWWTLPQAHWSAPRHCCGWPTQKATRSACSVSYRLPRQRA